MRKKYDFLIIGAGIYGLYAAKLLEKKHSVLVIDSDHEPLMRASKVNQARLHNGYHYPRSKETAIQASTHFDRFLGDFEEAIYKDFNQIYAVSSSGSKVSSEEFEEFCSKVKIPLERSVEVERDLFTDSSIQKAYKTKEYAIRYDIVSKKMMADIKRSTVLFNTSVIVVDEKETSFEVLLSNGYSITVNGVINATYGSINQVNKLFNKPFESMKYELCELVLCRPPKNIVNKGITVMDGDFFSIMPFGKEDLYSLWSVKHSVIETSTSSTPAFKCQDTKTLCNSNSLKNCDMCPSKPKTNVSRMRDLLEQYLVDPKIEYVDSLFTVKAISTAAEIDDSRLVYFRESSDNPYYAHVFSGKINCIYELDEKLRRFL